MNDNQKPQADAPAELKLFSYIDALDISEEERADWHRVANDTMRHAAVLMRSQLEFMRPNPQPRNFLRTLMRSADDGQISSLVFQIEGAQTPDDLRAELDAAIARAEKTERSLAETRKERDGYQRSLDALTAVCSDCDGYGAAPMRANGGELIEDACATCSGRGRVAR